LKNLWILSIFFLSINVIAKEDSFKVDLFDTLITLPSDCILKIRESEDPNNLAFYKCNNKTNVLINTFDYQSLMELQRTVEVTKHTEQKVGDITHFHIEATIDTPLGESKNFIDAFCDVKYCIIPLGPSSDIAASIEAQLKSMPNKPLKQDF